MSAVDLYRRITRAIERGRGGMMLTQSDLDVLLESGAYDALCDAVKVELRELRKAQKQDAGMGDSSAS